MPDFEDQFDSFKQDPQLPGDAQIALIDFVGNDLMGKHVDAESVAGDMERVMQRMVDESGLRNFLVMLTPVEDYNRRGFNRAVEEMVDEFATKNRKQGVRAYTLPLLEYYKQLGTTPPPDAEYWKSSPCFNQFTRDMCSDPSHHFKFDLYHISTLPNHATANHIATEILARWGS